jgi:hypothetical protein
VGRRTLLVATALVLLASSAPAQKSTGDYVAFVGSYTHPTLTTTSAHTAHVWASPNGKYLKAVSWQSPDRMDQAAGIAIVKVQ